MANIPELPPKYYLDNYEYLLAFVEKHYKGILSENEWQFYALFQQLKEDEKCLYIRMVNRRGQFFRFGKFSYPEINPVGNHLPALLENRFAHQLSSVKTDQLEGVFRLFTKVELVKRFKYAEEDLGKLSKLKRDELVALLINSLSEKEISAVLLANEQIIKQGYPDESLMFRFLFFGNLESDMSTFVVRDIGHLKFQTFNEKDFVPNFKTRDEAEGKLWALILYEQYRILRDEGNTQKLYEWFMEQASPFISKAPLSAQAIVNRLVLRVGSLLEKAKAYQEALKVYPYTVLPPSRERQARLAKRLKQPDLVLAICEEIIKNPKDVKESVFATDFMKSLEGGKYKKSATSFKQQGEYAQIDLDYIRNVELGALHYFEQQGYHGFFSENYTWRSLFGLLLWEEIFDSKAGSIHHPLQVTPSDFFSTSFREGRKRAIVKRLQKLENKKKLLQHLYKTVEKYEGTANPMVSWHPSLMGNLEEVCRRVEGKSLKKILWLMAENLKEYTKGFPDLFVFKENEYAFIEVKSPNDQLSDLQFFWQEFLNRQGVNTKVLNVYW